MAMENRVKIILSDYVQSCADLEAKLKDIKLGYLIYGVVVKNTVNLIAAPPKSKKTFLALDMAISIATGRPWLEQYVVEQGKVLYINLEVATPIFLDMKKKLAGTEQINDLLITHTKLINPYMLQVSSKDGTVKIDEKSEEMLSILSEKHPHIKAVFIDSFRRAFIGNASNGHEIAAFYRFIGNLKIKFPEATIFIIIHSNKRAKLNNPEDAVGGSIDLLAGCDNTYIIQYHKTDSAEHRELYTLKSDFGRVRLMEGIKGIDYYAYDYFENESKAGRLAFRYAGEASQEVSKVDAAKELIMTALSKRATAWSDLKDQLVNAKISASTFNTARSSLEESGRIFKNESGLYELKF